MMGWVYWELDVHYVVKYFSCITNANKAPDAIEINKFGSLRGNLFQFKAFVFEKMKSPGVCIRFNLCVPAVGPFFT